MSVECRIILQEQYNTFSTNTYLARVYTVIYLAFEEVVRFHITA